MGWLVYRHAVVYRQEFGWNEEFEALVAEILAAFIRNYDPKRERCWIADRDGVAVGSVFLGEGERRDREAAPALRRPERARARASAESWSTPASSTREKSGIAR